jgi:auxin responsive GH3 family protein
MHLPELLPSNPPSLSEKLKRQANDLRSKIIRTNYRTKFVQNASALADFRHATAGCVDEMDDDNLFELFRKTVHFTAYDSYAPLTAKFSERPCKASAIVDLFAPGIPDFISESSSTSGGLSKSFPKYDALPQIRPSEAGSWAISDSLRRRTRAYLLYLGYNRTDVCDEDNRPIAPIYVVCEAAIRERKSFHLDPEADEEKMGTFILDHAAPYAAGFIGKWRSFLLIHALFAVGSRSLEAMEMVFLNTFVDMIRYLDMEFDMVVDCIANGTIPELDGISDVRHYLELNISPDPERAAEIRRIGRPSSRPGWCAAVWPKLHSVTGIASGSFASSIPLARWFLGPNTEIRARGYGSTEAPFGGPYNPLELNQFKLDDKNIFEFLDVNKSDTINDLAQTWRLSWEDDTNSW